MTKQIPLTKGLVTIVDDEDYAELSKYKWHSSHGYATRWLPRNGLPHRSIFMHNQIIGKKQDFVADHINGNPLDNRKENLRLVTYSQNCANCCIYNKPKTSKYRGVWRYKATGKWASKIRHMRKVYFLGYFESETEAALAYDRKARELHGRFARTNF